MDCKTCGLPVNDICYNCNLVKQLTIVNNCLVIDFITDNGFGTFKSYKLNKECNIMIADDAVINIKDGKTQVIAKVDSKLQKIWGD